MSRLVKFVRDFIRKIDIKRHLQNLNIEKMIGKQDANIR